MKKYLTLVVALVFVSNFSFAAQKAAAPAPRAHSGVASDPISPNQGSDTCGLGWQVTDKKSFIGTTTRGTTDSALSPFGMTSGTWGCEQHTFVKRDQEAILYVATNVEPLSIEMAEGRGEFLQAFARTMGCSDSVAGAFGQMTQKNYEKIMNAQNGVKMFQNVKQEIANDPVLMVGCNSAV